MSIPEQLDAARQARTVLAFAVPVVGAEPGGVPLPCHLMDVDGALWCLADDLPPWSRRHLVRGRRSPAFSLRADSLSGAPQPDRRRGVVRAWIRIEDGRDVSVRPCAEMFGAPTGSAVVRCVPEHVSVRHHVPSGRARETVVPLDLYRAARPDALAGWEADWAAHLDAHHADAVADLVRATGDLPRGSRVHVLGADEGGIEVRVYEPGRVSDRRLDFGVPVVCGCEALAAFTDLLLRLLPAE